MKLIGLHDIPYKEKKMLVASICQMYKRLDAVKEFVNGKRNKEGDDPENLNDRITEVGREHFRSSSLFEMILNLMNPEQAMIIRNDFLGDKGDNWHVEYWSRTTYFTVKKSAIDSFLFLFYV